MSVFKGAYLRRLPYTGLRSIVSKLEMNGLPVKKRPKVVAAGLCLKERLR